MEDARSPRVAHLPSVSGRHGPVGRVSADAPAGGDVHGGGGRGPRVPVSHVRKPPPVLERSLPRRGTGSAGGDGRRRGGERDVPRHWDAARRVQGARWARVSRAARVHVARNRARGDDRRLYRVRGLATRARTARTRRNASSRCARCCCRRISRRPGCGSGSPRCTSCMQIRQRRGVAGTITALGVSVTQSVNVPVCAASRVQGVCVGVRGCACVRACVRACVCTSR